MNPRSIAILLDLLEKSPLPQTDAVRLEVEWLLIELRARVLRRTRVLSS